MTLSAEKVEQLELLYRTGVAGTRASADTGVSVGTVYQNFTRFRAKGIPRPKVVRAKRSPFYEHKLPTYTGPTFIGTRIAQPNRTYEPVITHGLPGWIGKRINVSMPRRDV